MTAQIAQDLEYLNQSKINSILQIFQSKILPVGEKNMAITSLSYLGINSENFEDWLEFATKILGMQVTEKCKNSYSFRMDNQKQRISVNYEKDSCNFFFGLEVDTLNDLESYAERLERAGVLVYQGDPKPCQQAIC